MKFTIIGLWTLKIRDDTLLIVDGVPEGSIRQGDELSNAQGTIKVLAFEHLYPHPKFDPHKCTISIKTTIPHDQLVGMTFEA